jgi:hypothetical protein
MRARAVVPCALALWLTAERAIGGPHVVVLEPRAAAVQRWTQGQRAVVAELSASGFDLVLRSAQSDDLESLAAELVDVRRQPDALGAVAVARQGPLGLVLVVTAHSGLVRIEVPAHGAIAEGEAALRVAELLRSLNVPSAGPGPKEPVADEPASPSPAPRASVPPRRAELWADAGVALSSDIDVPLPALGIGAALPIWGYLSAELGLRAMPLGTGIDTAVGSVHVRAAQASAYVAFAPPARRFGFSLGLGAGALGIEETAQGAAGFRGHRDRTWAALLSARARVFANAGPLVVSVMLEPGVTVPSVTVRAEDDELARFGRPWANAALGLGLWL